MHRSIRALGIMFLIGSFITAGVAGPAFAAGSGSVLSEDPAAADPYADTTNPAPDAVDSAPEEPGADPTPPVDAASAADEGTASAIAKAFGHTVTVDSETTETEVVEAQPDGTFQLTSNSLPVRVQRDDAWVDVDPTLSASDDGFIEPAATTVPVRFSAGGDSNLAEVQLPTGEWMAESWDLGTLPAPTIERAVATYPNALPDVDLVLTATATGMTEVLVVKTAAAAANPKLASLDLSLDGASASLKTGGVTIASKANVSFLAKTNMEQVLRSSKPLWWDSSAVGAGPAGPSGDHPALPVDSTVSGDTISLDVTDVAAKPGISYPLYIDPSWTGGAVHAWYIDRTYPDVSYLDGTGTRGIQEVGYTTTSSDGLPQLARSFWRFDTSPTLGKVVSEAHVNLTQTFASTCNPIPTDLYWVNNPGDGATWAQSPDSIYRGLLDVKSDSYGCAGPHTVGYKATDAVVGEDSAGISVGYSSVTVGVLVADESDPYSWREYAVGASLTVDYHSFPNIPSNVRFTSPVRGCGTAANPVYVNPKTNLSISAYISDPDGEAVTGDFYVVSGTDGNHNMIPNRAPAGYLSAGSPQAAGDQKITLAPGDIPDSTFFAVGVAASKTVAVAGTPTKISSAKSNWCWFSTDGTPPALPTASVGAGGTVGKAVSATFTDAPSDHVTFEYWWSHAAVATSIPTIPVPLGTTGALPTCGSALGGVQYACADSAGHVTVKTAPVDDHSTLWVAAIDAAGNISYNGTSVAVGTAVTAAPDPTVDFDHGHGWLSSSLTGPSLPNPFPDANTSSSTGYSASQSLSLGAGFSTTTPGTIPSWGSPLPVFSQPGFVALDEVRSSTDRAVVAEADVPPGYGLVDAYLGHIAPVIGGDNGVGPAGTVPLYSCTFTNGDEMTTVVPDCGGVPVLQKHQLGYIWTASAVPAGYTAQPLYRCSATSTGDHFDTVGTAGITCEGQRFGAQIGWVVNITAEKTAGPVVDTSGSYSVSAWVYADQAENSKAYRTIASQAGNPSSAFYLQEAAGGALRFCVRAQVAPFNTDCAIAPSAMPTKTWVFVTGIWDSVNREVRLLETDSIDPVATTSHIKPATEGATGGALSIGSAITNAGRAIQWSGMIANPTVFPGVLDQAQHQNLFALNDPDQH